MPACFERAGHSGWRCFLGASGAALFSGEAGDFRQESNTRTGAAQRRPQTGSAGGKWRRERIFPGIFPEECKFFSNLGFPVVIMGV